MVYFGGETIWVNSVLRIKEDSEFYDYYKNIVDHLRSKDDKSFILDDYFTPHDSKHCYSIEKIIDTILSKWGQKLSELETFILLLSIWTHDLGMFSDIAEKYFCELNIKYESNEKRRIHDAISAWYLTQYHLDILLPRDASRNEMNLTTVGSALRSYIDAVNVIIKYHRRITNIEDCPEFIYLEQERIRCRLLSCLLRLGDTLHIDSSRYNELSYNILQFGEFDRFARLHWLKSFMISNIYLDDNDQSIALNIDLPDIKDITIEIDDDCDFCLRCVKECSRGIIKQSEDNKIYVPDTSKCNSCKRCIRICRRNAIAVDENNWMNNINNLEFFLSNDINDDLMTVYETFKKYGLPIYISVKCKSNFVPGFNRRKAQEILGVLSDLDLIFSPNSSNTITKALESIKSQGKMKFKNPIEYDRQYIQLILRLEQIWKERPCHIGLKRIIDALIVQRRDFERIMKDKDRRLEPEDVKSSQDSLLKIVSEIKRLRKNNKEKIYTRENLGKLAEIKNVFLFGTSEMVSMFLRRYADIDPDFLSKVNLYIFEGASKRRYSTNNILEYDDGIYYSLLLSKMGFKIIKILPDSSCGSLFNILSEQDENELSKHSVVLFGANGIDRRTRTCAHSSGHLSLAIIAKWFKVPVWVIADSFKIGDLEWNLNATRKSDWLTTQRNLVREMEKREIERLNFREDKIPSELIATIISDDYN